MHQGLFADGAWTEGDEPPFSVEDKWSGEVLGTCASASAEQVHAAIGRAASALARGLPAHRRAAILSTAAEALARRADELAQLICREAGKPIGSARGEVERAQQTLRLSAAAAVRLSGESLGLDAVPSGEGITAFTRVRPAGVVAAITPFNFPLNLVAHKLGPALAAGCPVVLKPSEKTPFTAGLLVQVLADAGLPPGWVEMVTGDPVAIADVLLASDDVDVLTFTGSARVGWGMKVRSPRKTHILELGSNTGALVAPDADIKETVSAVTQASFGYAGQACISLQRLYVHTYVWDAVVEGLVQAVTGLPVASRPEEDGAVGPMISAESLARVQGWISEATSRGAQVLAGGRAVGRVMEPTILTGVDAHDRVVCDEVFGPVLSVLPIASVDEGIRAINDSDYGLNAAVFTGDLATALRCSRELEVGSVLVNLPPSFRTDNMPYGGVKSSGQAREGVAYAVEELTEETLVLLKG